MNIIAVDFFRKNAINIHVEFVIDEYAIIFFVEDWFNPEIDPIIRDKIIGVYINLSFIICLHIIIGGIFIIDVKVKQFIQVILFIIDGTHICIGDKPIFNIILIINIVLWLILVWLIELIKIEIIIMEDEVLWIIKYFIGWSFIFFFVIKGKNINRLISNVIHNVNQLFVLSAVNVLKLINV